MAGNRQIVLATGEVYHVFNRGVERRPIFTSKYEYQHALDIINFYRFTALPMRFSKFKLLPKTDRYQLFSKIASTHMPQVEIIAFCLMSNHFHFLIKQTYDNGISNFVSRFCNSHSKYFNTRHNRVGHLFQGPFKAVRVETEEQLVHLSRYIHLNPVSSFLTPRSGLDKYLWSSYLEYLGLKNNGIVNSQSVISLFKSIEEYRSFVNDHIDYAQKLERMKHLIFD
ncbi:MAG: transposase [Patescibacteria group bacterium]